MVIYLFDFYIIIFNFNFEVKVLKEYSYCVFVYWFVLLGDTHGYDLTFFMEGKEGQWDAIIILIWNDLANKMLIGIWVDGSYKILN